MGTFLSLTSVVGKTEEEVVNSFAKYAKSCQKGLERENLSVDSDNCCVIEEANGNTTIFYSHAYLDWDSSSEFISKDLNAPVFSLHIHDGDLWMYLLFVKGEIVDKFNPVPDYWEDVTEDEMESWKGNTRIIATYVSSIEEVDIERYLVFWDLEAEKSEKAYADDEFEQGDWQLLDFMKKLRLPYPINDDGEPKGETYKLWTKELPLQTLSKA